MAGNNVDRQFEEAIGSLAAMLGQLLTAFFKGLWRRIKKLNKWQPWVGAALTVLIALGAYLLKDRLFLMEVQNYIK